MTVASEPTAVEIDKALLKDTLVVVLLDRSGSMASMKDTALESLNGIIHNQKMKPDGLRFSLMLFDEMSIDFLYTAEAIEKVARITPAQFQPRAGTPLLDSVAKAIIHADSTKKVGEQVMIAIITDGLENQSTEYNRETLFSWIQNKQDEGWEFMFMGANQDAWDTAHTMGIKGSAYTYDSGSMAMAAAGMSSSMTSFRSGNYTPENVNFTEENEDPNTWETNKWPKGTPRPLP